MTDATTRSMPSALPPSEAELAEWQSLSREEQIARYREALEHPDSLRISDSSVSDVLAKARQLAASRRG
ncbi:MAG: hypothetical protein WA418_21415 [Bradyrhizobium sp.]